MSTNRIQEKLDDLLAQCEELPTMTVIVTDNDALAERLKRGPLMVKGGSGLFKECKAATLAMHRRGLNVGLRYTKVLDEIVAVTLFIKSGEAYASTRSNHNLSKKEG